MSEILWVFQYFASFSLTFPVCSKFRLFPDWKIRSHFPGFSSPSGNPGVSLPVQSKNRSFLTNLKTNNSDSSNFFRSGSHT